MDIASDMQYLYASVIMKLIELLVLFLETDLAHLFHLKSIHGLVVFGL